jgi:N-glycosylase/DNA lyase
MDLDLTLSCGQAFRWRKSEDGIWQGVVGDKLIRVTKQGNALLWKTYPEDDLDLIRDYFRLDDDAAGVYRILSERCEYLAASIQRFYGMRLVRQDPREALYSFVCSAANSIPRIMTSIEAMCARFGKQVCEHEGLCYYAFPETQALLHADELHLRTSGSLAFRAKHIQSVAAFLSLKDDDWLLSLRDVSFQEARKQLAAIRGVGPKIADCVCLFALNKDESVPVDTHIRQIGCRLFLPEMGAKCVTDNVYRKVQGEFVNRYGQYAGWAQQFLFYDDLLG